jgi:GT2 family glycosyltransferase
MTVEHAGFSERESGGRTARPGVDFVVCARNNRGVIGPTLDGIARQNVFRASCTVVDGLSTDGTPDFLHANFPFADVVVKKHNSGPAHSRNIGMARGSAEWIIFVDSDVELCPDWAEKQIAFMEAERVDLSCGNLVYATQPDKLNAAYGGINRFGVCWNGGQGQPAALFAVPHRCLWVISAAMIVRRSVMEAVGGFDEDLFAFYEDCDFGWRTSLCGFRVMYNPGVTAFHKVHSTMNERTMGSRITYLVYRNRIRTSLINYEARNVLRYLLPYLFLALGDLVIRCPRVAKLRALIWNVRNLPGTLRRRRAVQKKRKVRDHVLWDLFESGFRGPGYD